MLTASVLDNYKTVRDGGRRFLLLEIKGFIDFNKSFFVFFIRN